MRKTIGAPFASGNLSLQALYFRLFQRLLALLIVWRPGQLSFPPLSPAYFNRRWESLTLHSPQEYCLLKRYNMYAGCKSSIKKIQCSTLNTEEAGSCKTLISLNRLHGRDHISKDNSFILITMRYSYALCTYSTKCKLIPAFKKICQNEMSCVTSCDRANNPQTMVWL